MSGDIQHYMTVNEAAEQLGLSALYVRILARTGLLSAKAIEERSGGWTGKNTIDRRVVVWLVDPRPESRDWRTYREAATELGVERSRIRSLVYRGELDGIETGDPRLKVVSLTSLEAYKARRDG